MEKWLCTAEKKNRQKYFLHCWRTSCFYNFAENDHARLIFEQHKSKLSKFISCEVNYSWENCMEWFIHCVVSHRISIWRMIDIQLMRITKLFIFLDDGNQIPYFFLDYLMFIHRLCSVSIASSHVHSIFHVHSTFIQLGQVNRYCL